MWHEITQVILSIKRTNEKREVCAYRVMWPRIVIVLYGVLLDIGKPPLQCVLRVLKTGSLGTWSQGTVLLQPLPCACVYMLGMPYAKWLVLLLRFPLAALLHSQLNEELSESGRNLKQSDIELLVLLIKNFTPASSHEHLFVSTLWRIENGHHLNTPIPFRIHVTFCVLRNTRGEI